MGAESRLRQRHRDAIRVVYPRALIVGQPANAYTGPGRHDLYVVVQGRYVGLELKVSTGRATAIQLQRITDTRRAGGWAWVVYTPAHSLGAIRAALEGVIVSETSGFSFDDLFGEQAETTEKHDAGISAFLEHPDTQAIENNVNGINPELAAPTVESYSGDGGEAEVVGTGDVAALHRRIDNLTGALDALTLMLQDVLRELGVPSAQPAPEPEPVPAPVKAVKAAAKKAREARAAAPAPEPAQPAQAQGEPTLEDFLSGLVE